MDRQSRVRSFWLLAIVVLLGLTMAQCTRSADTQPVARRIAADDHYDKVHGAWQAIMVANHTGLVHEGVYLDEPSPADSIELVLLDQWSTDDDTAIEWVDLHIMETHGLEPTYVQIRDEWMDHLNHDIWVATLKARQLMDEGVLPPQTGSAELNPDGVWSMDAQLEVELFGLIAPGLPDEAARRARYFARVTNSGLAVEVSAFYAALYAMAFFESDPVVLLRATQTRFPSDSDVFIIVENVFAWHAANPDDWRPTRELIRQAYDHDPEWWASRVNFAATVMALLYGQGDLLRTMTVAGLAGWDADNNMTTAAGLLGLISGFARLPPAVRDSSDVYFNEDVTGDLPEFDSVANFARRTQRLAENALRQAGGSVENGRYSIPVDESR